jgi:hypothetical protein
MERAVVSMSGARNLASTLTGANGPERELEMGRSNSATAPLEMRLYERGARN